ncbi:MAG: heparinase II/III family protein [Kiritimatiellae bacterium]|nr:heparinase II/III family protein [Kiritimatiellia bacterium]
MKTTNRLRAAALAACLLHGTGLRAAENEWSAPPAQDLLERLRHGHPRLLVTNEEMARLKRRAASDRALADAFALMRGEADRIRGTESKYGGVLRTSREAKILLWAWRMTQEQEYARRVWEILADGGKAECERLDASGGFKGRSSSYLYISELIQAMALAYDWCYGAWSPEQRESIRNAIVKLELEPALAIIRGEGRKHRGTLWYEDDKTVQAFWYRGPSNWNATCSAGVVLGALAIADEMPELAGRILEGALNGFQAYARSFAPDGGSSEGPGYLGGGMSDAVWLLASLETGLGTDFGLSSFPGFGSTGEFLLHITSPTGLYFAFGDTPVEVRRWPYLFWLARRFDRPDYAWYAREGEGLSPRFGWFDGDRRIWDALWYGKPVDAGMIAAFPRDRYFRNAAVRPVPPDLAHFRRGPELVALRGSWTDPRAAYVGLKASGGLIGHDQCDAGTFVLDALGQAWAEEQGNPGYATRRPKPRRGYEYYGKKEDQPLYRTEGQNALLFNPDAYVGQERNARCPILSFRSVPERAHAVADLTAAYTRDARRVLRGVALLDRKRVLVQDEFEAAKPSRVLWTMHTRAGIELVNGGAAAVLSKGDQRLHTRILAPEGATFEVLGPGPLPSSPPTDEGTRIREDMRKLTIPLRNAERGRIAVLFLPLEAGQEAAPGSQPPLTPLEAW